MGDITVGPGTPPPVTARLHQEFVSWCLISRPPQVHWRIESDSDVTGDFLSLSGSVRILQDQREAEVVLRLMPDSVPELEELYVILLTAVEGGATLAQDAALITTHVRLVVSRQNEPPLSESRA